MLPSLSSRDAPRLVELAVARSGLAALGDQLAFRREHLQPVVAAVDDDDVAVLLDRDARRAQQFAVAAAGLAELGLNLPFGSNTEMVLVHSSEQYTRPSLADRDAERPGGLAVALAVLEELGHQLLVARAAKLDAVHPHAEIVLVAAVGGVEVAVVAQAHRLDVVEAGARRRAAPDGVAPVIGPATNDCGKRHNPLPCSIQAKARPRSPDRSPGSEGVVSSA